MHLKSLTLKGFKSFASATTFHFEPGITAVVGPNGSGKSNVVDALAWVMGEQGAKSLRGGKMEDVIFAGTTGREGAAGRAPLGRAEVSLTIDNTDGALPIDYAEVTISRTMFRNGGSEYAINGQPCRLLDVQELLSDSGIGREMHVIVGQGQLDAVLSAGPEERRGFIEEAAGVLKHRKRKEKALRKLDAMQANLTRVQDLTVELRRQLKPLGRQAEVARRAAVIQSDLRDSRLRILADDLVALTATLEAEVADETALRARRAEVEAALAAAAERETALEQAAAAEAPALTRAQETWYRLSSLRERFRGTGSLAAERVRHLARRARGPARRARTPTSSRPTPSRSGPRSGRSRPPSFATARRWLPPSRPGRRPSSRWRPSSSGWPPQPERPPTGARDWPGWPGRSSARRSKVEAGEAEIGRLTPALEEARERAARAQAEFTSIETQVAGLDAGEEDLDSDHEEAALRLAAADDKVAALRDEERDAEQERAALVARKDALELGLARKDGAGTAARRRRPAVRRPRLGRRAGHGRDRLRDRGRRRAGLGRRRRRGARRRRRRGRHPAAQGRRRRPGRAARRRQRFHRDPVRRCPAAAAPGSPVRAGRRHGARRAAPRGGPPARRRRRSSTTWPPRGGRSRPSPAWWPSPARATCSAGSTRPAGRPPRRACSRCRPRSTRPPPGSARPATGSTGLRFALQAALDEQPVATRDVQAALDRLHESDARMAAVAEQLGQLGAQARAARGEAERLERSIAPAVRAAGRRPGGAGRARGAARRGAESSTARTSARARHRRCATSSRRPPGPPGRPRSRPGSRSAPARSGSGRCPGRADQLARAAAQERDEPGPGAGAPGPPGPRGGRGAGGRAGRAGRPRPPGALAGPRGRGARAAPSGPRRAGRRDERGPRPAARARQRPGAAHRQRAPRRGGPRRAAAADRGAAAEGAGGPRRRARVPGRRVRPAPAGARRPRRRRTRCREARAATRRRTSAPSRRSGCARAERALALLGRVNPLALEEFQALEERHQFLAEQLEDLKATRRDLLDIIREVDERVEQVFTAAFHDTAREFEGVFARLFPGGEGRLVLTEPGDMLTTGIEVEARPPGKKVKRLSLLSGGERSLTAVALLVAIFKARPSPFYVMDEVEAALDDTNLGRLIAIMEELREASQLIVITHQKRTMEVADALYGVSMRGDGVTTVIGQRLREAEPA